jgi:hypothetical protein
MKILMDLPVHILIMAWLVRRYTRGKHNLVTIDDIQAIYTNTALEMSDLAAAPTKSRLIIWLQGGLRSYAEGLMRLCEKLTEVGIILLGVVKL